MRLFSILLIIISLISCSKGSDHKEIINYLENDLNQKVSSDEIYFIIYDGSCSTCIKSTATFLENYNTKKIVNVVFIGNSKKRLKHISDYFKGKIKIIYDTENKVNKYKILERSTDIYTLILYKNNTTELLNYTINDGFDLMKKKVNTFFNE